LQKTYGFRWQGAPVAMDLGLLYPALQSGKIDIAAGNATDGMLSALDVKVLRDDRGYFPPYDCSIVVRQEVLQEFGGLRSALEELSGKISDETMRKLNYEVDGKHRSVVEVAAEWLKTR
jgi:osmoprotectant transport system substrate-binding protein